jgi:serine/threonine protein phosphatase PrpC
MKYTIFDISRKGGMKVNQDSSDFSIKDNMCCCVIADGLGGHFGGEIASNIAVKSIINSLTSDFTISCDNIRKALENAQIQVIEHQNLDMRLKSMRTTLVMLSIEDNSAIWSHLGDSRLYFFRNKKVIFQTKDHSVPQALFNCGDIKKDEIRFHEDRNKLIRVMGESNSFKPVISGLTTIESGDSFLLCTDGFWEYILEEDMEKTLGDSHNPKEWINAMERILLDAIKGENDNYTAMAVFIH